MNHADVSKRILSLIGDSSNITNFTHCVTRLRFNVKDKSLVNVEGINSIKGVMGSLWQGDQYQVIVGGEVEKLYSAICQVGGITKEAAIKENLDPDISNKKLSVKSVADAIFNYLSPMMTTVIPLMISASLCKVVAYLLGPDILGLISADDGLYVVLNFVYNAFFYFLPVYLGYVSGKVLGYNPIYGMYLGCLIIVPDFVAMNGSVESISLLGLPIPVLSYSGSFLPVLIGGVLCKYVLEFLQEHTPSWAQALLVPTLTVIVMTVLTLVICAPLATYVGTYVGNFFMWMYDANIILRVVGAVILTIAWPFLILFGMHGALSAFAMSMLNEFGFDPYLFNTAYVANAAVFGVALGVGLKLRRRESGRTILEYFVTCILGGITEPILYGVLMKYRKSVRGLVVSCAVGGLLCGVLIPKLYVYTSTSILGIWACWAAPGQTQNLIMGNIVLVVTFLVSVVVTYIQGYEKETSTSFQREAKDVKRSIASPAFD